MRGPIFVGAYGDCIDFTMTILWKEATNTDIEEPVFIGLNIGNEVHTKRTVTINPYSVFATF